MERTYEDTATDAMQFAKDFCCKQIVFTDAAAVERDPHFNGVWRLTGIHDKNDPRVVQERTIAVIYLPGDQYSHNADTPPPFQGDVEMGEETEHKFSGGYR